MHFASVRILFLPLSFFLNLKYFITFTTIYFYYFQHTFAIRSLVPSKQFVFQKTVYYIHTHNLFHLVENTRKSAKDICEHRAFRALASRTHPIFALWQMELAGGLVRRSCEIEVAFLRAY